MALPVLAAALARAGPALAKMFSSGGGQLVANGGKAASAGGGMDMAALAQSGGNPFASAGGSPGGGSPAPSPGTGGPSGGGLSNFMGNMRGGLNDMGFSGLAKGIQENIEKLRAWTDGLHSSNMQFAEFSASMASVQAQAEVREYQLKRQQGDSRAGSAGFLAEQKGGLDKSLAPIENLWAKFENLVGGGLLYALNLIAKPVGEIASWLDSATDSGDTGDAIGMDEELAILGKLAKETVDRRPPRLR